MDSSDELYDEEREGGDSSMGRDRLKDYFKTKRSMQKFQTFLLMKSINVIKGTHKLKILLKKHQLVKQNFIYTLKFKGSARIPDDLKIQRFPISYQFYDPIPELLEKYT